MLWPMKRILTFVLCLFALSEISAAQNVCSTLEQQKLASEVAQIRQRIHKPIPEKDDQEAVPAPIQQQLSKLKDALAQTATAVVACHDTSATPSVIEKEIATLLHANPPQPPDGATISN